MSHTRTLTKNWLIGGFGVALPLCLLWLLMAQMSWRPKTLRAPAKNSSVAAIAYSPDGQWLVIASSKGAELRAVASGEVVWHTMAASDNPIAIFSPDSKLLAINLGKVVQLWDVASHKLLKTFTAHPSTAYYDNLDVMSLAFSPNSRLLAAGGREMLTHLWNIQTGQLLQTLGPSEWETILAFAPDGKTLAATDDFEGYRTQVSLIDVANAKLRQALAERKKATGEPTGGYWKFVKQTLADRKETPLNALSYAPDGTMLAIGGGDNSIRLWDGQTGHPYRVLKSHAKSVLSVTFAPDGRLLASGSEDGAVKLWNPITGILQRTLYGSDGAVNAVSIAPAGATLAAGYADGTVKLWRIK